MGLKDSKKIARNYALALSGVVNYDVKKLGEYIDLFEAINSSVSHVKNANKIFSNPIITISEKKELLKKMIQGASVSKEVMNFLFLLIEKKRFNLLPDIQYELKKNIDKASGVVYAEVFSVSRLNENVLNKVQKTLENTLLEENEKVKIENKIEPDLIGGLKIKVKDLVYDGSIRGKLEGLKRRFG